MDKNVVPVRLADGRYQVEDKIFDDERRAWRYIDRQTGDPISRQEDTSDWAFNRSIDDKYK